MRNLLGQFMRGNTPANKKKKVEKYCESCGKAFQVHPFRSETARFCSPECRWDWLSKNKSDEQSSQWRGGKVEMQCQHCGKPYKLKKSQTHRSKYCSRKCHNSAISKPGEESHNWGRVREDMLGANNKMWKGGLSKWRQKDHKHIEWRTKVFKRDNYACQKCKKRGVALEAHHIKSWSEYPELRYVVSNGISLCVKCHSEVDEQRAKFIKR